MSHFKAKMHRVRFLFVRLFFLTQSTSCSDVRRQHGVMAAIAVDVVAMRICTSVRPSVHGVWHYINTNVGWQNRLHLTPKNLGFVSPRFWQKNCGFRFRFGNRYSTKLDFLSSWPIPFCYVWFWRICPHPYLVVYSNMLHNLMQEDLSYSTSAYSEQFYQLFSQLRNWVKWWKLL